MASYLRRQQFSESPVIEAEILNLDRSSNILDFLNVADFIPLKMKRRLLYLKTQSVPRCKHFLSRL
jgi:hypothetical protein